MPNNHGMAKSVVRVAVTSFGKARVAVVRRSTFGVREGDERGT